jgi:hypothetical protein
MGRIALGVDARVPAAGLSRGTGAHVGRIGRAVGGDINDVDGVGSIERDNRVRRRGVDGVRAVDRRRDGIARSEIVCGVSGCGRGVGSPASVEDKDDETGDCDELAHEILPGYFETSAGPPAIRSPMNAGGIRR